MVNHPFSWLNHVKSPFSVFFFSGGEIMILIVKTPCFKVESGSPSLMVFITILLHFSWLSNQRQPSANIAKRLGMLPHGSQGVFQFIRFQDSAFVRVQPATDGETYLYSKCLGFAPSGRTTGLTGVGI